jgi:hypothetical protein
MSRRLVFGAVSRQRLVGLSPIGIVNGREVFPIAGAEDDDDSATPGDEPDENDDDDDDDDSDDDKDDKPAARSKRSVRNSRTSEFNRLKRERNALLREKQEREKAAREAALKEKPEIERAKAERDDATKERDELRERLSSASVELEIIKYSRNKYDWADIEDVLNDRTVRKAIEIGEDGEITGVSEALKDLAKRKPHFLVKPSEEDDKNGKNDNGRKTAATSASNGNGKSGGNPGSGNGDNLAVDRERLNAAYPALARLPQ